MTGLVGLLAAAASAVMYILFKNSLLWSALSALSGLAAFVFSLLKGKKSSKIISIICLLLALVCMFFTAYQKDTHPVATVVKTLSAAEGKDPAEADALLTQLSEKYSGYNGIYLSLAEAKMNEGKYAEAEEWLDSSQDYPARYFMLQQQIAVNAFNSGASCRCTDYYDNWMSAVQDISERSLAYCPDYAMGHTMAGVMTYYLDSRCNPALYYLSGSLSFDCKDGNTWYYLGLVEYYLKNYEDASECFANAEKYGTEAELKSQLKEYTDLAEKGGRDEKN